MFLPPDKSLTTYSNLTDLIVVRVPNHPAAVLLGVDGFSLAALHGVDQCHAPAKRAKNKRRSNSSKSMWGEGVSCGVKTSVAPLRERTAFQA